MTANALDKKLMIFVRDMMRIITPDFPEKQIFSGRCNEVQNDFNTDYIVVDDLAPSERISGQITYDGDAEVQTITNSYITTFTIDFYGDNAYDNINKFILLARSQAAYELKIVLGIGIYQVSTIQDLKKLTAVQRPV